MCVWNGYNGDSEIVKVLDRQTVLKRWIAAEIRWYRNVVTIKNDLGWHCHENVAGPPVAGMAAAIRLKST